MSWRDIERVVKNDDLQPPTGDNVRKQASFALKALLKVFGGDKAKASDFVSKTLTVASSNDTMILNSVVENLDHLSSKMNPWKHYNVMNIQNLKLSLLLKSFQTPIKEITLFLEL